MLEKLHFDPANRNHDGAKEEFLHIQAQLELEKHESSNSTLALLRSKRYRRRMWTGFFLQCIGQTTGVLVINSE